MGDVVEISGWVTAEQAAKLMGCTVRYLYRIKKFLPPSRIGRALLYRQDDIERYIEEHPRLSRAI